jgi:uncharacterized protein (TIGR00369 family)
MSPLLTLPPEQLDQFLVGAIPHHCQLGMRAGTCGDGVMGMDLPWDATLAEHAHGGIHSGAITTLIDALSGSVVLTRMTDFRRSATLDLRMDFLRAATHGQTVYGHAEVQHMDSHVAFTRAVAHHGDIDDPIARSSGCFALFKGKGSDPLAELAAPVPAFVPHVPGPPAADASAVQQALDAIPYARMMGITLVQSDDTVTGRLRFGPHLIGNPVQRILHGGALASLMKFTAAAQLAAVASRNDLPRLFSMTLEFVGPSQSADVHARAIVVSATRRFANVRVAAYQDDPAAPIAVATMQFRRVCASGVGNPAP